MLLECSYQKIKAFSEPYLQSRVKAVVPVTVKIYLKCVEWLEKFHMNESDLPLYQGSIYAGFA